MIYLCSESITDDPIRATLSRGDGTPEAVRIRICFGSSTVRLDTAAAVDLVDAVVAQLAKLEPGDAA